MFSLVALETMVTWGGGILCDDVIPNQTSHANVITPDNYDVIGAIR
jgi:hypothetical protein